MAEEIAVDLIVEAITKGFEKLNRDIDGVGKSTERTTKRTADANMSLRRSLTDLKSGIDMVVGAARTAGQVMETVYNFGKQGTELDYAIRKFDRLSEAIGTTGHVLMYDLGRATEGLMSDAQLISAAGDLMSLGLSKTHDQTVRMARVSALLDMNLNQLALTLTNQTTARFDQLGVAVDGFDDKLAALEQSGMDTNAAFTEAFLQQAEEQIERVGSVADTAAGKVRSFESAWEDFVAANKLGASGATGDFAERMVKPIDAMTALQEAINRGRMSKEQGMFMFATMIFGSNYTAENVMAYVDALYKATEAERQYGKAGKEAAEATKQNIDRTRDFADEAYEGSNALDHYNDQLRQAQIATMAAYRSNLDFAGSFLDIDTNMMGTIGTMLDQLEYKLAGGGEIQAAAQSITNAIIGKVISEDEGMKLLEGLFIAEANLQEELDNLSLDEAAKEVSEKLNVPLSDALKILRDFKAEANENILMYIDIKLRMASSGISFGGFLGGQQVVDIGVAPGDVYGPVFTPGNPLMAGGSSMMAAPQIYVSGVQDPEMAASIAAYKLGQYQRHNRARAYAGSM